MDYTNSRGYTNTKQESITLQKYSASLDYSRVATMISNITVSNRNSKINNWITLTSDSLKMLEQRTPSK